MTSNTPYPIDPILLVDDETAWLQSLTRNLEYFGNFNHLVPCNDCREVLGRLRARRYSVVLLDLVMPHIDGTDLLVQIGLEYPDLPVIVLSGMNQLETAVRCMKLGAFDYHVKTAEADRLWASIRRALEWSALSRENRELGTRLLAVELRQPQAFAAVVTRSPRMEAIFRYLEAIAASASPVLFLGAKGSGRQLLAATLATLHAPTGPFVTVPAADLNGAAGEQLLLGTAERPGRCQSAQGGCLLLEEIELLSPHAQTVLVEILKRGEFTSPAGTQPLQFRLLASAGADFDALVADGRFRRDLAVRLDSHRINVPALHERGEDLPLLLDHFLLQACNAAGRKPLKCPEHLASLLLAHPFDANCDTLRQLVADAVAASRGNRLVLTPFHKALSADHRPPSAAASIQLLVTGPFPTLNEARAILVEQALQRAGGSQTIAARLLGITQPALSHLLKRMTTRP